MTDMVNHPSHYTTRPAGMYGECIEYTRYMPFAIGNAFKYVWRAEQKWNQEEDLKKAVWYLRDAATWHIYADLESLRSVPRIDTLKSPTARLCFDIMTADHATIDNVIYRLKESL